MFDWISIPPRYLWWIVAASVVGFFGTLAAIPVIVARMRADYFVERDPPESSWLGRYPAMRIFWRVLKNLAGVLLLLAGIAMLVLPGQGLLTILLGLMLLDFPGKRRLEIWLVQRRGVQGAIGWIREKAGRAPLQIPDGDEAQKKQPGG